MEKKTLKNIMENIVADKLDDALIGYDCCKCESCKMDMMAYALNHIQPKYVVSHMGSLYAKLQTTPLQYSTDLLTVISKAIKIISEHPRHDDATANNSHDSSEDDLNVIDVDIDIDIDAPQPELKLEGKTK